MKTKLKIGIIAIASIAIISVGVKLNNVPKSKTIELTTSEASPQNSASNKADNQGVTRYDVDGTKFKGYVLEIKDPKKVKVGYAKDFKTGETTSQIANRNNAIAAINAGAFEAFQEQKSPLGIIMSEGKVVSKDDAVKTLIAAINNDGKLITGQYSVEELQNLGVKEAVTAIGTELVVNGIAQIPEEKKNSWGLAPRTAIGQKQDGTIIFLVIDGRQETTVGATIKDVQDIMLEYNAVNAVNLDGGSSSTMYYNGDVINKPSNALGERLIPSIIYAEK
jgi:exopolysaccharide biosynthesis protein